MKARRRMKGHYLLFLRGCCCACLAAGLLSFVFMMFLTHGGSGLAWAGEAGKKTSVKYVDGRLSVSAKDARLGELLLEVSRRTGITIESGFPLEERISVEFADQPLEAGLMTLLRNKNYSFVYLEAPGKNQSARLSRVSLVGRAGWQGYSTKVSDRRDRSPGRQRVLFPSEEKREFSRHIESFLGQNIQKQMEALEALSQLGEGKPPVIPEEELKQLEQALDSRKGDLSALEELMKNLPQTTDGRPSAPSRLGQTKSPGQDRK